jgi:hypothetical protein
MTEHEQPIRAERIYIREAAELLDRRMGTLRKWEQLGLLPAHLLPQRGERGWRYWTPEQLEGIKQWIKETDRRPGKGLPYYDPTATELEKAVESMRRPRRCVICDEPIKKGDDWTRVQGKAVHRDCITGAEPPE